MRLLPVLLFASLASLAPHASGAPPERAPEAIDYSRPDRYVAIPASAGRMTKLRAVAKELKDKDPDRVIRNVHAFVASRVPHVPDRTWRPDHQDAATLLGGFDHADCARHGLVFGSLLRACGVPVVYVKSMRHDWIRTYVSTGKTGSFSGHVFLEVHIRGKWRLLDAQGMRIWDDHDPTNLDLPGGLLAYEKGRDHFAMVHSTRRNLYIEEAKARWSEFDVSALKRNDAPGRRLLPQVWAITLDDEWKALAERIPGLSSFNRPVWGTKRKEIHGGILIVTSMGGRVGIPDEDVPEWLPASLKQLKKQHEAGKTGLLAGKRPDGTVVLLLAAPGRNELMQLIWSTDFAKLRSRVDMKK
jgi:transglutaminase superfamily protein